MYFSTMYMQHSSSSSSSSSPSGIVTPVDEPHSVPFTLPRYPLARNESSSSESGQPQYQIKPRPRLQSFSKASVLSTTSRPRGLSVDCTKASAIPARFSDLEDCVPSGSFSQAGSAEGHLRSLISRDVKPCPRVTDVDSDLDSFAFTSPESKAVPFVTSFKRHTRSLSLRSFPFTWSHRQTLGQDSEKDVPRRSQTFVPCKTPSSYYGDASASQQSVLNSTDSITAPDARTRYAQSRAASTPSAPSFQRTAELQQKSRPHRANTISSSPVQPQPRTAATLRFPSSSPVRPIIAASDSVTNTPRVFLKPKSTGKTSIQAAAIANARAASRQRTSSAPVTPGTTTPIVNALDPALAAAENSSRFRAKCVCGVCGKMGVDYPRCPRCPATW